MSTHVISFTEKHDLHLSLTEGVEPETVLQPDPSNAERIL